MNKKNDGPIRVDRLASNSFFFIVSMWTTIIKSAN